MAQLQYNGVWYSLAANTHIDLLKAKIDVAVRGTGTPWVEVVLSDGSKAQLLFSAGVMGILN